MPSIDARWKVKPASGGSGPFYAVAPDGVKHGPFDTWEEASVRVGKEHELISERELRKRARGLVPLLLAVKARGGTQVHAEYNGGGDEGNFEGLDAEGTKLTPEETEQLEDYFELVLYERWCGWQDNEGAFGEFVIDLTGGEITVQHVHNSYTQTYETSSHTDHLPVEDGEEPAVVAVGG